MAAEKPTGATNIGTEEDPTRGRPYHDSETAKLKQLLKGKVIIDEQVKHFESQVAMREQEYFESTPNGNILTGFDSYIKGTSGAAGGGRRKAGFSDNDRVFSRSALLRSEAIDSPAASSVATTPAPTPVNSTFLKGDGSTAGTPTSGTSKGNAGQKKGKRTAGGEDSETDTKEHKKVKTSSRK